MPPKKASGAQKRGYAMTPEHKEKLVEGREQTKAVARYLEALEAHRPKRGRRRTIESVQAQLSRVEAELPRSHGVQRLELIQQQRDLQVEVVTLLNGGTIDLTELEKEFVKTAKRYAERKGVTYGALREFGVPAKVLADAGITRGF